jgi:predicted nuclease of predicted toxin-antitoxin system
MKLLLDQNISYRLVNKLQNEFPNSKHVNQVNLINSLDIEILRYAHKNDYVLITYDEDFYELSLNQPANPKIVWLRRGNLPTNRIFELLLSHKRDIEVMQDDVGV